MRILFVKYELAWPRASGHDVHTYSLMQALTKLGHEVALATDQPVSREAVSGLDLTDTFSLADDDRSGTEARPVRLSYLQERFRRYWGVDARKIRSTSRIALELSADAVVSVGLEALPYLSEVQNATRIWYAADEWLWHHLSLLDLDPQTWGHVQKGLLKGLYERSYASVFDRAWVVSEPDRTALRWVAGKSAVDVIPHGVDSAAFSPPECAELPNSCAFWGRLDFEPNIRALRWFCGQVWPRVAGFRDDAVFNIYGFNPTSEVAGFANTKGVLVHPNVENIREAVSQNQLVVLPFFTGGGVKNKLLEASAMAKPIVCTRRALNGLSGDAASTMEVVDKDPVAWARSITGLWDDSDRRAGLGAGTRRWVIENHSWTCSAEAALRSLSGN